MPRWGSWRKQGPLLLVSSEFGSTPLTKGPPAPIAQRYEQLLYTETVGGSIPSRGIPNSTTMTEFEHDEVQDMIDKAIAEAMRKHNRNATLISACLGLTVLAFYSHGLVKVVHIMQQ